MEIKRGSSVRLIHQGNVDNFTVLGFYFTGYHHTGVSLENKSGHVVKTTVQKLAVSVVEAFIKDAENNNLQSYSKEDTKFFETQIKSLEDLRLKAVDNSLFHPMFRAGETLNDFLQRGDFYKK